MPNHFDLFVLGAGSGGVACARASAALGARVGIAEVDRLGGTCVNRGCVPKKLLVYASHYAEEFRNSRDFGWKVEQPEFDWPTLKENVRQELLRLNGVYERLLDNFGVMIFRGEARFLDAKTVQVGNEIITADRFMIATGGKPWVPDIPGKELGVTSNEVFTLPQLPGKMAIIGGGYIAQEMAGIFHGMGVDVTLVVRCQHLLRGFDVDIADHLQVEQAKKGLKIHCATHVEKLEKTEDGITLVCEECSNMTFDTVLFATGRRPNISGLELETLGVKLGSQGEIETDDRFRTSVEGIYAIGDVTNRVNLTPVAIHEGRLFAADHFGGESRTMDYSLIPTTIFSQPPLGTVGLTEREARKQFSQVEIYRSTFRPMKYGLGDIEEKTLMKLVVNAATNQVLGVHLVGPEAAEILQGFAVALKAGATKTDFDRTVGIHPSSAEEFVTMREPVKVEPKGEGMD